MPRRGKYYFERRSLHLSIEDVCLKIWLTPKYPCHGMNKNHFCSLSVVKKDVQDFFAPDSFSLWLHLPITFQFFVCGSSVGWLQPWGLLLKNACPFHFPLAYLAYFEILSVSSYYTEITFLWCIKGGERGKKASVVFTVKRRKLFLLNLEHFVFPDFFIFFLFGEPKLLLSMIYLQF